MDRQVFAYPLVAYKVSRMSEHAKLWQRCSQVCHQWTGITFGYVASSLERYIG